MQKIKRIKELFLLAFQYIKEDGIFTTFKRSLLFFKRRLRSKKGRFLPPKKQLELQRSYKSDSIKDGLISVVTALYNTDLEHLKDYVDSFLNQSYQYKQLVLVDASDDAHKAVGEYILSLNSDEIFYHKLSENKGISENTNIAVSFAKGEYICLADHDDILSLDALYQMAKAIDTHKADFIYSDEALFSKDYTKPIVAHFKPDFSYYYLTNCNYICHLACIKTSLFLKVGGLVSDFNGAQDHDLFLKLSEIKDIKIHHIPKVLYYWRVHENSTSSGIGAKPYVTQNAISAINAHLKRKGIKAKAQKGLFESTYKINYDIENEIKVSIVIPNKDHIDDLEKCLKSVYEKTRYQNFEVVVVENNSTQKETFSYYEKIKTQYENLSVIHYQGDFNFAKINNFAINSLDSDAFLMLNNDIEIINEGWLSEMVSLLNQENVGIVGAMLYYEDDTVQHAGVITGLGGFAGHSHKYHKRNKSGYMFRLACVQNLSCVTAACLLVSKKAFMAVDGMDEGFKVAFNDVDFCLNVRDAGYDVLFTPYSMAYHYESKSRGLDNKDKAKKERFENERILLKTKHPDLLNDPFYNINLTKDSEDFTESRSTIKYEEF